MAGRTAYVPLAVDVAAAAEADPVAGQRRAVGILDAVAHGLGLAKMTALAAADQGDRIAMILALPRNDELDERLAAVCTAILGEVRRVDGVRRVVIGAGAASDSLLDTAHELPHVAEVALSLGVRHRDRSIAAATCACAGCCR